jgi:mannose-6-phosphate isomerase
MQHVSFTATEPVIVNAKPVTANEKVYKTPAPDFELSTIKLATGQSTTISTSNATILLATEGSVVVTEAGAILTISAGQAFLATANSQFLIHANTSAVLYRAAVPVA